MNIIYKIVFYVLIFSFAGTVSAQTDTVASSEKVKKGFSMGGVPVVAYNSDVGFKYGALVNLYHYGDGSRYPNYNHSLYLEWSRTTKGSGINQMIYETQTLIPNTRMILEASYLTELALDFYGFNGAAAYYNPGFEQTDAADYISRMYYRHSRELLRLKSDFQGNIGTEKTRWLAGFEHYGTTISPVDIAKLNEGKPAEEQLPDVPTLYDNYVKWNVIPDDQKEGGTVNLFKIGFVYDTRNMEANPERGLWEEAMLITAPGFLGNDYAYNRLAIMHRHYVTIPGVPNRLTFAYRLAYQMNLSGQMPFYMLPYVLDTKQTRDGLGGSNNLRGIMRNRIVGNDFAFANAEFRWIPFKTIILKQNFYLGINLFADAGMVTKPYDFNTAGVPSADLKYLDYAEEKPHIGYGAGIRLALNNNFIIAVDYGMAADKQDGSSGLYIGLNYIY